MQTTETNYQFYHIYPLGMLRNRQINSLCDWIDYLTSMNINGLYLGPVFQSVHHGYDTIDYQKVDDRLGTNEMLRQTIDAFHEHGIDIVLDCVFNHVSRSFFAFKDVLEKKEASQYRYWFYCDFEQDNGRRDGFNYETWAGHDELVKLNLQNDQVKEYLINISQQWVKEFDIDGLRLDAADVMDQQFIKDLSETLKRKKPGCFIMGEMVHGNYAQFLADTHIDSVTNYEIYKGLYSSLNDKNYFEIAYSLNRLFGEGGLVKNHQLYNFVDNHDVNRIASTLNNPFHIYPLYIMLYTIKGYTSIYYKSELGETGLRTLTSDSELRKEFRLEEIDNQSPILNTLRHLSSIRKTYPVLCYGEYREILVHHEWMIYLRYDQENAFLILINACEKEIVFSSKETSEIMTKINKLVSIRTLQNREVYDHLNEVNVRIETLKLFPHWGRILQL